MFDKLFKKTTKKVEDTIDEVKEDTTDLIEQASDVLNISKEKLELISTVILAGFSLSILANVLTIYCCTKAIKSINKQNLLAEVAKLLKERN